ncbi:putative metal transporter [Phytophthora cinnamomi]|uniref:putative metal transporter n=1 Tax=Phytophthora cinnamomi TaxID=4785 RepID=UPI00355A2104|nr:putative metal transporter [Phytophthora cinnamomi]
MRRSRAALLGFACSTLLPPAAASSMTSMLIRAASATLVARRTADVEGYQEASAGSSSGSGSGAETSELMQAIHYGAIVLLIVMSAISSGLTLGLMSLDKVSLDVIIRAGDRSGATADEMRKAKAARRILPVRADSNLLLTTLVLTTVAVNSLLSILMADLTSGLVGFFVSTIVILICGEIVPQSLCSRHALSIGSALVPVVKVLRLGLYIFAKPVSFVLDKTVGEDVGTMFTKRELQKLMEIHVRQKIMHPEEGYIVRGAMSYKRKAVSDIMIPAEKLFSLPAGTILNLETLKMIYNNGYSRIPVWNKDPNDIVGIIFTKDLIYVDPGQDVPLIAFARVFAVAAHRIWLDAQLGEVLSVFKMGSTHMALVYDVNNSGPGDPFYELKGLVTLEDIVEEILQSKIIDETDSPEARKERENCTDKIGYFDGVYSDEDPLLSEPKTTFATTTTTLECNATVAGQETIARWSLLSELTFSRDSHAAAAFADQIWIVGGVSASYYTKRLEYTTTRSDVVSSPDGVEWTEVLEEAPFRRRYGHSLIAFTDSSDNVERLTLLGGFSPEPATDIWVTTDGASWTETTITVPWTDGCGLCVTDPNARYENSTSVPTLFLLAGNVGVQKVNDVFRSSDGMLCEQEGTICSGEGVCVQGGTCLCSNGKTGALCDSELPYTIVDSTSCFPESAPVIVLGGKTKRLGDVKIGDSVLALNPAGEPVFSTVYYIPHESFVDGATDFISVEHEGLTHEQDNDFIEALQLTPDHLVYYLQESEVFEANFYRSAWKTRLREPWTASLAQKPASELQVNDLLLMLPSSQSSSPSCAASNTENDPPPRNASRSTCWSCPDGKHGALPCQEEPPAGPTLVRVTRLTRASRRGAKTVYTMTGNLFVAGVLCSNFGDYYPTLPGQQLRDSVAFKLFAPHRAVFRLLPYTRTAELLRVLMDQLLLPVLRWLRPLLS